MAGYHLQKLEYHLEVSCCVGGSGGGEDGGGDGDSDGGGCGGGDGDGAGGVTELLRI